MSDAVKGGNSVAMPPRRAPSWPSLRLTNQRRTERAEPSAIYTTNETTERAKTHTAPRQFFAIYNN